jgi:AcrR family transcriptional regulator
MQKYARPKRQPATRNAVGRPSAREALLEVALDIIRERDVGAITYEALAERSGLSKGGVLYHFPNREEMNRAIREHVRSRYRDARYAATEALPEGPSRKLKGWAIAALHNRSRLDQVSAKIMSSGMWNSDEGLAHHRERFEQISRGVGFDRAALVYLATEGLWFLELLGFAPFTDKQRQRIVMMLLSVADGAEIGRMVVEAGHIAADDEKRLQTVATGVTGEPTAPGKRKGGAVRKKR